MSVTTEQAAAWFADRAKNTPMPGARAMFEIAATVLQEKAERENPQPLTIDELRQMDGEPVWVQPPEMPQYGRWAIVEGVDTTDGDKTLYLHDDFTCHEYGRVWLAYRHKPKEVDK